MRKLKSLAPFRFFLSALVVLSFAGCATRPRIRYTESMFDLAPVEPEFGIASWYQANWLGVGEKMADGKRFRQYEMTCAHRTLPLGTFVRVTNLKNGHSTIAKITDRGPYVAGRIVDLSKTGAHDIDIRGTGLAPVRIEVLVPRDAGGS